MSSFTPTSEQIAALDLFRFGDNLAIEAGAGTGKTSTLQLLAETASTYVTGGRGQYLAFNKAIVVEAGSKMPANVTCSTAHSLAFRAVGRTYAHRLNSGRVQSAQLARQIGIDPLVVSYGEQRKPMAAGYLAGHLMAAITRFCQSADRSPSVRHFPYIDGIDPPDAHGARTFDNNNRVAEHLEPFLAGAWRDLMDPDGRLPYKHEHYLKAWQLSDPRIHADFVLFDEAQDANPVMLAVVAAQDHAQLVFVGDSQQAIYEFTGAVNALAKVPTSQRVFLTQSFRFGPEIADIANDVLGRIPGAELRLTGSGAASVVGPIAEPDVVLSRTNAAAVKAMLYELQAGRRPHLVGGGGDVKAFARAARDLKDGKPTQYRELACFESWGEVQEYVENDPAGGELKMLVGLMDDYGPDAICRALDRQPDEADADRVFSTAHKSKGREWDSVALAGDYPDPAKSETGTLSPGELRLIYVACTRARRELDVDACALFDDPAEGERL